MKMIGLIAGVFILAALTISSMKAEPDAPADANVPPKSAPAVTPANPSGPVALVAPAIPPGPPKQMQVDVPGVRAKYPNLMKIKNFSTVDVVIIGSKAKLQLKENELNEFANYCVGQLFKGYEVKAIPQGLSSAGENEFGTLNVIVNTYPQAVSIELRMGTVGSANTWTTNELRVSTNSAVKDGRLLKTSIATMIAKAAYTLRKTQGK